MNSFSPIYHSPVLSIVTSANTGVPFQLLKAGIHRYKGKLTFAYFTYILVGFACVSVIWFLNFGQIDTTLTINAHK